MLIVTNSGRCDRAYRYGLSIRRCVIYDGSAAVNVAARQPERRGEVRVWAGQRARAAGWMSRDSGSGNWRGTGSMGTCSGVWDAERR